MELRKLEIPLQQKRNLETIFGFSNAVQLDQLPPRCAEIFKLSRFEGLKYQEIADHLEISIKTVEVQMGKALKVLREKLQDLKVME